MRPALLHPFNGLSSRQWFGRELFGSPVKAEDQSLQWINESGGWEESMSLNNDELCFVTAELGAIYAQKPKTPLSGASFQSPNRDEDDGCSNKTIDHTRSLIPVI